MAFSRLIALLQLAILYSSTFVLGTNTTQCASSRYEVQPRAFILTDMSNEPDDQMSLVRFLMYANEISLQGISAVTSVWKNDSIDVETIRTVITAYGDIVDNLNANVPDYATYPSSKELLAKVLEGHPVYGLAALELEPSEAAMGLVQAIDQATKEDPQWVLMWGGGNVLAETLQYVSKTRGSEAVAGFTQKIRVYSISDQDDAGSWIRNTYPEIFYVVSLHGFSEYTSASWNGISGEAMRYFDMGGPDTSLVTNEWLQIHVRDVSSLGQHYPNFTYIMEGDTPSFFPLIQNGLGDPEHPEYGSWGGRFKPLDASRRSNTMSDTADWVRGLNGQYFMSMFAGIWRWRRDYQYDFANRFQWTASADYSGNNHAPVIVVNGTCGPKPMQLPARVNGSVVLDASGSWDPDGDDLTFDWIYYYDVTYRMEGNLTEYTSALSVEKLNDAGSVAQINLYDNQTFHVVLSVTDPHNMTTYRRVMLDASTG